MLLFFKIHWKTLETCIVWARAEGGTQSVIVFSWWLFLAFFVAVVFLIHSCSVDSHKTFKRFIPIILILRASTMFSS